MSSSGLDLNLNNILSAGISSAIGGLPGALMGGLGTIFSSNAAKDSAAATNAMNYRIWQEQRQHNEHMYNRQREDVLDFWNRENAYNDPSAVRERWENAGFNPYLMMQGSGVGTAGSLNNPSMQGSTPPQMQQPSPLAFESPLTAFANAMRENALANSQIALQSSQGKNIDADTEGKKIENSYRPHILFENWEQLHNFNSLTRLTQDIEYETRKANLHAIQVSNALQNIDYQTQMEALKFMPAQTAVNFFTTAQNLANMFADGKIKFADLQKRWQDYYNAIKTGIGIDLDNQAKRYNNDVLKVNSEWARTLSNDKEAFSLYSNNVMKNAINVAFTQAYESEIDRTKSKIRHGLFGAWYKGDNLKSKKAYGKWQLRKLLETTEEDAYDFDMFTKGVGLFFDALDAVK